MIAIIDYGMGNLRSVQKALERTGGNAQIVTTPAELARANKIVLPGVAAFGDAIAQLREMHMVDPIVRAVRAGTPYLGFCLGLQLLFDVSYENGEHTGLGLLPGKVVRFNFPSACTAQRLSVPHMGWNQIQYERPCPMLTGIPSGSYAYFAHSYHVVPIDNRVIATTTEYGYRFTSSVWRDNIFATQFHPEKSQAVGLRLLENFVRL
ncbi:MAG: Imidazole glycerol phosphate synthase subunit HisH 1 [Planctomycetes bacterium ADurb.Bin126]|nr:MAG: Imidazole glycerol phosphate synthase subunit HisH 1 [Planctomycetes bacterium ADurb.Bin126]HOD80204.1 imidazole glycerol phosphate synthase subunit HisH [Phycisphaerae bacterium]HQL71676.1 imidazole glycerol phosphate synthase subunit HisH [Phycisphaerae bacterium]